jgi:hypothetical protein
MQRGSGKAVNRRPARVFSLSFTKGSATCRSGFSREQRHDYAKRNPRLKPLQQNWPDQAHAGMMFFSIGATITAKISGLHVQQYDEYILH